MTQDEAAEMNGEPDGAAVAHDPRPLLGEPLPLDLLNTHWMARGALQDLLATSDGLRIWLASVAIPEELAAKDRSAISEPLRRNLCHTREAILQVARQPADGLAQRAFNAVLAHGRRERFLDSARPASRVVADPDWALPWLAAEGYLELLDRAPERIKSCQHPDCVLWYLDTSKSGTRRWCSMTICGNRVKASRHYARRSP